MIQRLFDKNILIYGMVGLCGLGVLIKFMLLIVYGRLIHASDQMGTSRNKLMKSMCSKFEASYHLNMGVHNVDSFVDKYVYKHRFCGILLYTWEAICGQLLFLCMIIGAIGAILALLYDCGKQAVLFTFLIGISTSALLVIVDNIINLNTRKTVIRTNIQDYLENFLQARLASMEVRTAEREEEKETSAEQPIKEKVRKEDTSGIYKINKKEEKIIEDILKEYMV